jgi:hypothetical protein
MSVSLVSYGGAQKLPIKTPPLFRKEQRDDRLRSFSREEGRGG